MKTLLLICMALICAVFSVSAQEVRLDSLWVIYGGFGAMTFSPDSKQLLIAAPDGLVTVYESATGLKQSEFHLPANGYWDLQFTPDKSNILVTGKDGLRVFNAGTWDSVNFIADCPTGYIAFSPDGRYAVTADRAIMGVVNMETWQVEAQLTRPDKYYVTPNRTEPYRNGKVFFSSDGKYIIGKYANSLVQWNWRNAPDNPETLIASIPNRAILSFSPDKKYLVQQSNYLWDIAKKTRILLPLEEGNEEDIDAPFTSGSRYLVCTGARQLHMIDVENQRILYRGSRGRSGIISVSPDSSIVAYTRGGGNTAPIIERIVWSPTSVDNHSDSGVIIDYFPIPSSDQAVIVLKGIGIGKQCSIGITDNLGRMVLNVYNGLCESYEQTFTVASKNLISGGYRAVVEVDGHFYSKSFIINH